MARKEKKKTQSKKAKKKKSTSASRNAKKKTSAKKKKENKYKERLVLESKINQLFRLIYKSDQSKDLREIEEYKRQFYYLIGLESGKLEDDKVDLDQKMQGLIVMRVLYEDFIYDRDQTFTFSEFLEMIRTKRLKIFYDSSGQNMTVKYWYEQFEIDSSVDEESNND